MSLRMFQRHQILTNFFRYQNQEKICNDAFIKDLVTPRVCR